MKLYMFQCGTIKTKKHLLVTGFAPGQEFEVPVPFFLIKHPKGNILFDTGQALSAAGTSVDGDYIPVMTENDHVSAQLAKAGLKTTDISHIVLSHLHSDHAGGIEAFSQTTCYIQENELKYANNHGTRDKYPLKWRLLNGRQQKYHDIFGDGSIQIIFTPGHSPRHQSLLLKLTQGMIMCCVFKTVCSQCVAKSKLK